MPDDFDDDQPRRRPRPRVRNRRPADDERWIEPAVLYSLLGGAAVLALGAAAILPKNGAAASAFGLAIGVFMLLAGLKTLYFAKRGSPNHSLGMGYFFAVMGPIAMIAIPGGALAREWSLRRAENAALARMDADPATRGKNAVELEAEKWEREKFESAMRDLSSPTPYNRRGACHKLDTMKPNARQAEVAAALVPLLSDDDNTVRNAALNALGVWGTRAQLPAVEALAASPDQRIASAAKNAAAAIKARP